MSQVKSPSKRDMELTAAMAEHSDSALLSRMTASAARAMSRSEECCSAATLALAGRASKR